MTVLYYKFVFFRFVYGTIRYVLHTIPLEYLKLVLIVEDNKYDSCVLTYGNDCIIGLYTFHIIEIAVSHKLSQ